MLESADLLGSSHLGVTLASSLDQTTQAQVIDDVLNPLDVILDGIRALAQNVVLEVQQLEPGEQILDEPANNEGQLKVAVGDGVGGQTGELISQVRQGEEVLFDGEVEGITVLQVGWDWRSSVGGFLCLHWGWVAHLGRRHRLARA